MGQKLKLRGMRADTGKTPVWRPQKGWAPRNYESQASRWSVIADIIVPDELITGIAQYSELDLTRRPNNGYFSNGFRKEQNSGLFL